MTSDELRRIIERSFEDHYHDKPSEWEEGFIDLIIARYREPCAIVPKNNTANTPPFRKAPHCTCGAERSKAPKHFSYCDFG